MAVKIFKRVDFDGEESAAPTSISTARPEAGLDRIEHDNVEVGSELLQMKSRPKTRVAGADNCNVEPPGEIDAGRVE